MATYVSTTPSNKGRLPAPGGSTPVQFTDTHGSYSGDGLHGREWHITRALTGWRLEFRDPGDTEPTYAGTHPTLALAQVEASR